MIVAVAALIVIYAIRRGNHVKIGPIEFEAKDSGKGKESTSKEKSGNKEEAGNKKESEINYWYKKAAENGNKSAPRALTRLKEAGIYKE